MGKKKQNRISTRAASPVTDKTLSDVSVLFPNLLPGRSRTRTRMASRRMSAAPTSESRSELQSGQSSHGSTEGIFLFGGFCEAAVWTPPLLSDLSQQSEQHPLSGKLMMTRSPAFSRRFKSVRLHHAATSCRHCKPSEYMNVNFLYFEMTCKQHFFRSSVLSLIV